MGSRTALLFNKPQTKIEKVRRESSNRGSSITPNPSRRRAIMKIESMEELFLQQIEDLYDAEKRLVKALPKMAEASTSLTLKQAFESHLLQTQGHVTRLETGFRQTSKHTK